MTNLKKAIAACAGTIALACAVIQPATAADIPQYPPQYGGPPPVEEGYGYREPPRAYRYAPQPPPVYYEHAPPAVVVVPEPEPYYVPRRRGLRRSRLWPRTATAIAPRRSPAATAITGRLPPQSSALVIEAAGVRALSRRWSERAIPLATPSPAQRAFRNCGLQERSAAISPWRARHRSRRRSSPRSGCRSRRTAAPWCARRSTASPACRTRRRSGS